MDTSMTKEGHWTALQQKTEALMDDHAGTRKAILKEDLERLIQEIQGRQVELELQNYELMESRRALEETIKRYKELYNRYANFFDLAPNAYLVFDQTGIIREANLTAAILFAMPKAHLIGQPMSRFIHRENQDAFQLLKQDSRKSSGALMAELELARPGGRNFPAQIQLQSLPCSDRAEYEYRAAILDLSEQAQVSTNLNLLHQCLEIAVRATDAQQLLDAFVQLIKGYTHCRAVGIRLKDADGRIPYQAYAGFSKEFLKSESPLSLHSDRCLCIEVVKGRTDPDKSYFTEFGSFYINGITRFLAVVPPDALGPTRNVCPDYGFESVALIPIPVDHSISGLIHVADRRENTFPLRIVEILEQAAMRLGLALQRLHMQTQLSESLENLRELSSAILKTKEEEQRRIAMELHDQIGQDLNVLKLRVKQVQDRLRRDQPALKQNCSDLREFTSQIIDNVRRITRGLSPPALESLGLRAAVKQMAREYSELSGIEIHTHLEPLERIDDRETRIELFRIIQEALTNAHKHARATRMTIDVLEEGQGIQLIIADNGKGFALKGVSPNQGRRKGMGLAAMRFRSRMLEARLDIQSQAGQGTRITLHLPIPDRTR